MGEIIRCCNPDCDKIIKERAENGKGWVVYRKHFETNDGRVFCIECEKSGQGSEKFAA